MDVRFSCQACHAAPRSHPVTSGLPFGLTPAALTWVTSWPRIGSRTRTVLLVVFAAERVAEVAGITLQAWRRVPPHLTTETPFDTAVSMSLTVGGGVLAVVLPAFTVAAFRHRRSGPEGMASAVRAGFALLSWHCSPGPR